MGAVSLSSSPLSTLYPSYSPQVDPDYSNIFKIDFNNLNLSSFKPQLTNYAQKYASDMLPSMNSTKFNTGLTLSTSNNSSTARKGKQMMGMNWNTSNTSSIDWSKGFDLLASADQSSKAGQITAGLGKIGSSAVNLSKMSKAAGGFKNLTGVQKTGGIAAIAGATADLIGGFMPQKDEYSGEKGDITQTLDTVYDSVSDAAMAFGPVGMILGGAMKVGSVLGKGLNALGGGTDGKTTTDAILGSSFFNLTPFGLINGFGGKKTDTITKNNEIFEQVGTSYTGSESTIDQAVAKQGKYGAFSSGARKRANRLIAEAKRQQGIIEDISDLAQDRFAIRDSMAAINGNRLRFQLQGGYNQANVRVGKLGMSLNKARETLNRINSKREPTEILLQDVQKMKEGGQIQAESTEIFLVVPEFQDGGQINKKDNSIIYARQRFPILKSIEVNLQYDPNFRPREIGNFGDIEYMTSEHDDLPYYRNYKKEDQFKGKPTIVYNDNVDDEDIALDMLSHGLREQDENWKSYFLPNLENDWKQYIIDELFTSTLPISLDKFKNLSDDDKQRYFRQFDDDFKSGKYNEQYNSVLDGLVRALLVKDEFRQSKGYNYPQDILNNLRNTNAWKQAYDYINSNLLPEIIVKHQEGGSINVIPEGALHARKHNMDIEGITKKGIPVVSDKENGEVEQHAEIEREEIIFRLEVTQKLEELEKKFYNEETPQKEKDELALEAGKLLVEEILYNTQDNTNKLL